MFVAILSRQTSDAWQTHNRRFKNDLLFSSWHDWYMAWQFYVDLVLIIYPHRAAELQEYVRILSNFL